VTTERRVTQIDAVLRTVPDLAAAEAFYRDSMGFHTTDAARLLTLDECTLLRVSGSDVRSLFMRLGRQSIGFLEFQPGGRPYPADSAASDLWFQHCAVVVADMDAAYAAVAALPIGQVTVEGPQQLPPSTGGVRAFKFRDPFGHPLELLWLPAGVGDPTWHQPHGAVFLGIDHTAIAVGALGASLAFYRDTLGFVQGERTLNHGIEQDRLDGINHVAVDVVALQPEHATPHLELLAYRVGSRRPLEHASPADAAVSRTVATVEDLAAVERRVGSHSSVTRGSWRGRDALALDGPDGHAWICIGA
jgi:catechol 2,3-dioxygenase-like lactoylglutathione lyase family enzyme